MTVSSHLQQLRRKHQSLAEQVDVAQRSAGSDSLQIAEMKKQKLRLKEQISRLQEHQWPRGRRLPRRRLRSLFPMP